MLHVFSAMGELKPKQNYVYIYFNDNKLFCSTN